MLVHFMRVVGVNGLYRAALGTQAAAVTVFGGFRDHAGAASFFVGAIAGDGRLGKMARCQLFLNPGSKGDKLGLVLGIRPPGSKFPHDGMLGYSGTPATIRKPACLVASSSSTMVSSKARLPYTTIRMAGAPLPWTAASRWMAAAGTRPP